MNREVALLEQRVRIANAAKSVYSLRYELTNGIDCLITVQNKRNELIAFETIAQAFEAYVKGSDSDAKDFEQVSDELFHEIAKLYPERDIEIQIVNNNSAIAFTKEYFTHQPNLSIAI